MNEIKNASYWINKLKLIAHPEGGFYRETYRSDEEIEVGALPKRYQESRTLGTSIYFLLTKESCSNFHRLNSDEIWHFHTGGAGRVHFINPSGEYYSKDIGGSLDDDQQFQLTIPRNSWFAAEVIESDFILVGCTVAPGFEFVDFELADRKSLLEEHPEMREMVMKFTKA